MAIGYLDSQYLTDIADAIRTKKSSQNTMTVGQMPAEIASIPSGGSTDPVAVRFLDYDGTIVDELNDTELTALTTLPSGPDHTHDDIPLVFQEWNWDLADIKTFRTANPTWTVNVGANYDTQDQKTHCIYEVPANFQVSINVNAGGVTIDWGDGTTETATIEAKTHTYLNAGLYHVTLERRLASDTTIQFTGYQNFLKHLRVSSKVLTTSGNSAVYGLTTVSLPSNVSNVYFTYAKPLRWVTVPKYASSLTYSGGLLYQPLKYSNVTDTMFNMMNCPNIEDLYVTSNYTSASSGCYRMPKLKRIHLSSTNIWTLTGCFQYDTSLEEINLPSGLTTLANSYFSHCLNLKYVTLPDTLTSIGQNAFTYCSSLREITIPASVTSIARQAFQNCVTNIIMKGTTPPTLANSNAFTSPTMIFVPYSADHSVLNAYKTASNWSNHAACIIESPAE